MESRSSTAGTLMVLAAYAFWGFMPLYWKALASVPASVILSHRILWALTVTTLLLVALGRSRTILQALGRPRQAGALALSALLISMNWWLYIWAVGHGRVLESAFGYYVTPLMSVLLGLWTQQERLTRLQVMAFALSTLGVPVMTLGLRDVPWVALGLSTSFALYGLLKKVASVPALTGLQVETLLSLPLALLLLVPAPHAPWGVPTAGPGLITLLVLAGPVTALPLWLFGEGARRITMVRLGFAQFLSPTLSFLLGVFVFREAFQPLKALSFAIIWAALGVFMAGEVMRFRQRAGGPS